MSIQTSIQFLNANDPEFIAAKNGTPEEIEEWEDDHGPMQDRPGKEIECAEGEGYEETDDEYGGWIIALTDVPKDTTHIVISRG